MDYSFASKYPFTSEAKRRVEESELELNNEVMERAVGRVMAALKGNYGHAYRVHPSDELLELGSYAAARMMLAYLRNSYITGKFAVAEAKRASSFMRSDSEENLKKLGEELGIVPRELEGRLVLPVPAYVSFSPRSVDYRLIFRNVKGGFVEVTRHEAIRLMEEAVRLHMEEPRPARNAPKMVQEYARRLMALVPKESAVRMAFKEGENPPCVEKLLEQARAHQNLNHNARVSLAIYLLTKNLAVEKVDSIFSNMPDYDSKKTKYQLEHIRKRGYSMPSCATMLSYGLCVADCRVGTPLRWRNWKKRKKGSS